MSRRLAILAAFLLLAPGAAAAQRPGPTPSELLGSRLVVGLPGTTPSLQLLDRVRSGKVAGVILFARNVGDPAQVRRLTGRLQRAARAGGRPPLLVCVDQEGGDVRRLPWAAPARSASELARLGARAVRAEGARTGRALRTVGVNCDLAPVLDVPGRGSFLGSRAFASDATRTGVLAVAFARGLADAGVLAAVKHFPGIGRATANTDVAEVRIEASRAQLERDLAPFRRAIDAGVPLVMLSNASYSAFGRSPAGWSPTIGDRLLRDELGFTGVTITDSLDAPANVRGWSTVTPALLAARAGADLLLVTGSEETSWGVYTRLLRAVRDGEVPRRSLEESHRRVTALRRSLASR